MKPELIHIDAECDGERDAHIYGRKPRWIAAWTVAAFIVSVAAAVLVSLWTLPH